MWHFLINMLGIRHSLFKTSWFQTFLSSLSSDPLVLLLRDLPLKNNLQIQASGCFHPWVPVGVQVHSEMKAYLAFQQGSQASLIFS